MEGFVLLLLFALQRAWKAKWKLAKGQQRKKKEEGRQDDKESKRLSESGRAKENKMEKWRRAEEVGQQQEKNTLTPSVSEIVYDTKSRQHTESMAL